MDLSSKLRCLIGDEAYWGAAYWWRDARQYCQSNNVPTEDRIWYLVRHHMTGSAKTWCEGLAQGFPWLFEDFELFKDNYIYWHFVKMQDHPPVSTMPKPSGSEDRGDDWVILQGKDYFFASK